jgi:hypothetical protein
MISDLLQPVTAADIVGRFRNGLSTKPLVKAKQRCLETDASREDELNLGRR